MDTFGAFSGGIRNITNPIINPYEVSQQGIYRVNDKNKFDGFNTRMVYVPPELIDLLKQYWQIKQQLIRYLKHQKQFKKKNQEVAKDHHIFVLDLSKKGKIQLHPYKRNRCRDEIAKMAKEQAKHFGFKKRHLKLFDLMRGIKTNVNRHYLRGRLLELDVPGYFIDAYLGHWHTGTQPWGSMSLFHKELYFKMMKATLPKILSELGFKSPQQITQNGI